MSDKIMRQYEARDWEVVDYQLHGLADFPYALRGPALAEETGPHGAIIGAGQSFGVLVRDPYAHRLTRATGMPLLNLSVGGASPGLYLKHPAALARCNAAAFCIVQVLSARSSASSYFESRDGKNMLRPRGSRLPFVPGDTAFEAMFRHETPLVSRLVVSELRSNWIREMLQLLSAIRAPKILLWFSKRAPEPARDFATYREAAGVFPQFVTREMVEEVRPFAQHYVEAVGARGMPNRLTNRFTGAPATVFLGDARAPKGEDSYYPSPEMHEDACAALLPVVRGLCATTQGAPA